MNENIRAAIEELNTRGYVADPLLSKLTATELATALTLAGDHL